MLLDYTKSITSLKNSMHTGMHQRNISVQNCFFTSLAPSVVKQFRPRSGSKLFDMLIVLMKYFFEKYYFEEKSADD